MNVGDIAHTSDAERMAGYK